MRTGKATYWQLTSLQAFWPGLQVWNFNNIFLLSNNVLFSNERKKWSRHFSSNLVIYLEQVLIGDISAANSSHREFFFVWEKFGVLPERYATVYFLMPLNLVFCRILIGKWFMWNSCFILITACILTLYFKNSYFLFVLFFGLLGYVIECLYVHKGIFWTEKCYILLRNITHCVLNLLNLLFIFIRQLKVWKSGIIYLLHV